MEDKFSLYGPLSSNLVASLLIITLLCIAAILIGLKLDKDLDVKKPQKGFILVIVLLVEGFNKFLSEHLPGDKYKVFGPYLFSLIVYLAFANTASLIGLNPPLSNLGIAMSFTVITFVIIKYTEMRYLGPKKKLISLLGPFLPVAPLMLPINLLGEITTPLTMGMRLFGNLMSGTVISVMVYTALHWTAGIFAGIFIHAIFDIFFGLIQAFVFFMLSTISISMASEA